MMSSRPDEDDSESSAYSPTDEALQHFRVSDTYLELPHVTLAFAMDVPIKHQIRGPDHTYDSMTGFSHFPEDCPGLSGFCFSTYPVLPGKLHRSGDPIADFYHATVLEDGTMIASLADGCNWGPKSRDAALSASEAFSAYLLRKKSFQFLQTTPATDAQQVGHYLLRGFAVAHDNIVSQKEAIWDCGTTTLLGTILCPVLGTPNWMLLSCSVGDTRAYVFSTRTGKILFVNSSVSRHDASDPGGRLGPHLEPGGSPDLRNLLLSSVQCEPGDFVIMMTDGVYDNLDPYYLGVSPRTCGLDQDEWRQDQATSEAREEYIERFLATSFISGAGHSGEIARRICKHITELTQSSRDFHNECPNKKLPRDFAKYPGKMDHSSCLIYQIPTHRYEHDTMGAVVTPSITSSSSAHAAGHSTPPSTLPAPSLLLHADSDASSSEDE